LKTKLFIPRVPKCFISAVTGILPAKSSIICNYKKVGGRSTHPRSTILRSFTLTVVDSPLFKNDCLKLLSLASAFFMLSPIQPAAQDSATPTQLPNGRLLGQVPGNPREINNLPTAAALSPMAASWYFSTADSEPTPKATSSRSPF